PKPQQKTETTRVLQTVPEHSPAKFLQQGAPYCCLDSGASDIQQAVVLHIGGTGGFAGLATQAAIKMGLGEPADPSFIQHILYQVNAATGAVQLIAGQQVGRAGCRTETAMHTGAQNPVGFLPFRGTEIGLTECGLHDLRYSCSEFIVHTTMI